MPISGSSPPPSRSGLEDMLIRVGVQPFPELSYMRCTSSQDNFLICIIVFDFLTDVKPPLPYLWWVNLHWLNIKFIRMWEKRLFSLGSRTLEPESLAQLGAKAGGFVPVLAHLLEGPFSLTHFFSGSIFPALATSLFLALSLFCLHLSVCFVRRCLSALVWSFCSVLLFHLISFLLGISLFLPFSFLPSRIFLLNLRLFLYLKPQVSLLCPHLQLGGRK